MVGEDKDNGQKLQSLEEHIKRENPLLVEAVRDFRRLDKMAHRIGFLNPDQTFASQIAWWPLVSVLGTFSAGKSTFINHFLRYPLQTTGTQAVDEKFTVVCYTAGKDVRLLPGIALNSDPRFPFYKMSQELEKVRAGEGSRIDAYLQLKTCPSESLRGQIFIDSPGFDADAQRSSTLKITDYIIDLSDLVLVFFDARHPEPGAMQDTLRHLVANTIVHKDSNKFLYILNQIDTSARENNPEEVVGAWHRSMAQVGLTAARFYCIYIPEAATPIEDDALRMRYETKRDRDMSEIHNRIRQVGLERAYRIVGALQSTARDMQEQKVTQLKALTRRWRRRVLWSDVGIIGALLIACVAAGHFAGYFGWDHLFSPASEQGFSSRWGVLLVIAGIVILLGIHFSVRRWSARRVLTSFKHSMPSGDERENMIRAYKKNVRPWCSIFRSEPVGWGRSVQKQVGKIISDTDRYIQRLNDSFAAPSGEPFDSRDKEDMNR